MSQPKVDERPGTITVSNPEAPNDEPPKVYTFDQVFGPDTHQMNVYNQVARPIVENVLHGYNGTIFAYGQTGTGKTFTMEGNRANNDTKGIIPNSFAHMFGSIAKAENDQRFLVRVSYLEIYNEEIRDLLAKEHTHNLEIKERPNVGVYVKDLSSVTVSTADEMDKIMTIGNKNRSVGGTNMNAQSSRSHAIFSVTVECSELGLDKQRHFRVGKLHLVDLAGSERQSKSGATGMRLKEASKINLSLSTLGNVISALVDAKQTHIPYRNSKLTRLLQDSLGGNSKTVMIANVGPASYNYDETISTLRYANRAKNIKNQAHINEDPKDALLRKYQEEIEQLRSQLGGAEDDGEGGSGSESEGHSGDEAAREDGQPTKHRKRLNSAQLRDLEAAIAADRASMLAEVDMNQEMRTQLEDQLKEREADLAISREAHEQLQRKLAQIEKRVIVGGVNLLDKQEEQARLLEQDNHELETRRANETQLRHTLQMKQAEHLDIEEKYSSLQEEAAAKSKKLKKVWTTLLSAKSELKDMQQEHQREMEGMLDSVRELSRELRLQMLVIDSFIPEHYQEIIERYVHWNDDIGDWQLKCIAYTGNNMSKQTQPANNNQPSYTSPDLSSALLTYDTITGKKLEHMQTKAKAKKTAKDKSIKQATHRMLLQ